MIGLFTVSATVGRQKEIGRQTKEKVSEILKVIHNLKKFDLITNVDEAKKVTRQNKDKISAGIVAVATGGSERLIRTIASIFQKPILIWANPFNNSLPSSLEAFSKIKDNLPVKLFYSNLDSKAVPEIKKFTRVCNTINKINNCKLGCVGEPSKWILTSENERIMKQFGPKIVKLKISDLLNVVRKIDLKDVKTFSEKLKSKFGKCQVSNEELINAVKIYHGMKKLISQYNLTAMTIKCFDLIPYNYTACIGMSLCNDENLIAGCEADLQATLTMMIVSFLTNQPCWMANPSRINKDKNTVILAHCMIATKMISDISKATLLPHFESGKSVSVRGPLNKTDVTLVRLGGNLDKMLIAVGKVVRSDMQDLNLCRTQVEVKLRGRVEDFLTNSLGNHQILAYGNLEPLLKDFCKFKRIKPIIG